MPIRITVTLTEPFNNLFIYDHIDGNRLLFPEKKPNAEAEAKAGSSDEEMRTRGVPEKTPADVPSDAGLNLGPFWVETTGTSPRLGRLLFRHGDTRQPVERLFDVREGWNPLPPHGDFDSFAKFVVFRGLPDDVRGRKREGEGNGN